MAGMTSFPPVRSVQRALKLLTEMNKQQVATIGELHACTKLPKPTIVRLLETLMAEGFVSHDENLGGYHITSHVSVLSSGFHGAPLIVEAARPWAIDLTRRLKWPVGVAVLDRDAVVIRFSTIPNSPVSPFHATLNMRLSLISRALGRAYLAYCPREEREVLVRLLASSRNPEDRPRDLPKVVAGLIKSVRTAGFAERDPHVEPKSSGTIAVPIRSNSDVLATIGLTYFRSAVPRNQILDTLVHALKDTAHQIEQNIRQMPSASSA
jgi:IclR family transcriptional regulator, mhp operon transcriptional activator